MIVGGGGVTGFFMALLLTWLGGLIFLSLTWQRMKALKNKFTDSFVLATEFSCGQRILAHQSLQPLHLQTSKVMPVTHGENKKVAPQLVKIGGAKKNS